MPESRDTVAELTALLIEARERVAELHGMIKDAERAKRELLRETAEIGPDIQKILRRESERLAADYTAHLTASLEAHAAKVNAATERASRSLQQRAAEMAGMTTPGEFMTELVRQLSTELTGTLSAEIESRARRIAASVQAGQQRQPQMQQPRPKRRRRLSGGGGSGIRTRDL
jgi:hypothetical protein